MVVFPKLLGVGLKNKATASLESIKVMEQQPLDRLSIQVLNLDL
tara:strand:- start:185 stop:316 length:132 start_codon:yes stop_codon:yes gene_type:complete